MASAVILILKTPHDNTLIDEFWGIFKELFVYSKWPHLLLVLEEPARKGDF